jgi:putative DNA primase/helicase
VAFDSGNLKPVAVALTNKYPHYDLIICGDDDPKTPGNPGRTKATEAAKLVGARVCFPVFGNEDAV